MFIDTHTRGRHGTIEKVEALSPAVQTLQLSEVDGTWFDKDTFPIASGFQEWVQRVIRDAIVGADL